MRLKQMTLTGSFDRGNENVERGATTGLTPDVDGPCVFFDDSLRYGKSQAGSVLLGRKKWLKKVLEIFGGNSCARIRDGNAHMRTGSL